MNRQQIFDTAASRIIEQGVPSIDGEQCLYRDGNGNACAIGILLDDAVVVAIKDRWSPKNIIDKYESGIPLPAWFNKDNIYFLDKLQRAHDEASVEGGFIDEFISRMSCLLYTSPSPRDGLLSRMPSSA